MQISRHPFPPPRSTAWHPLSTLIRESTAGHVLSLLPCPQQGPRENHPQDIAFPGFRGIYPGSPPQQWAPGLFSLQRSPRYPWRRPPTQRASGPLRPLTPTASSKPLPSPSGYSHAACEVRGFDHTTRPHRVPDQRLAPEVARSSCRRKRLMAEAESIEEGRKATKQIEAGNLVSAPSF